MDDELLELEDGAKVTKREMGLIHQRIEELKLSNAAIQEENKMFEHFIGRLDPEELAIHTSIDSYRTGSSQMDGGAARKRRARLNISDRPQLLTPEQKLYVVHSEVTESQHHLQKLRKKYESTQDSHKESLEEAEMCLSEIRNMKSMVERKAPKAAKDQQWEKAESEDKMKRHLQAFLMRNLTLKNQALRTQEKKLQQQLQQKQQTESDDYEGIVLPSARAMAQFKPSDDVLRELQMKCFKAQHHLNSHKEKLQKVTAECEDLDAIIARKKKMLATFEKEIRHIEEKNFKTKDRNKRLEEVIEEYGEGPDPTDYILLQEKVKKLQKSVHSWEKKVEIAQLALKLKPKHQKAGEVRGSGTEAGAQSDQGHIPVNVEKN